MRGAIRPFRLLVFLLLIGTGLACGVSQETVPPAAPARVVYVVGQLTDEDLIALSSAAASADPAPILLLDTPAAAPYLKGFLAAYRPDRVVPIGSFTDASAERERRLGVSLAPALEWAAGPPTPLWDALFPQAERVVVCPAQPRGLLLQAACLAGAAKAPLFVIRGKAGETDELRRRVAAWKAREVLAVAGSARVARGLEGVKVVELADEEAVSAAYLRRRLGRGKVEALVIANPADGRNGGLSRLAPFVMLQHRAALLLTNEAGDNTGAVVRAALKNSDLRRADSLILLADLKSIPMERRPNPAAGKDAHIEMEPLTPGGEEPFTFATGRLFHRDAGVVALTMARQRLLAEARGPRKALVASNPGGGLPLMEMFSRHTAKELRNRGYETVVLFEHDVNKEDLRRFLPEQDIFLWEGHYKTMVEDYQLPAWTEPLRPSLVFLQSCLALNEAEAQPLVQRGAVALVGSSTRTYSGTGGAFTLAFFDAVLYDDQPLGAALRQAKNFLLAYSLLKQKRLGQNAKLGGANQRSAWAFTLWGDPTLKLPRPEPARDALPFVRHEVQGNEIVLAWPEQKYERVTTAKYAAQTWPNARLAGLLTAGGDEEGRQLVPFLFAEVRLSPPTPGLAPRLRSTVREKNWVFVWDDRRGAGYLLVIPLLRERREARFEVRWER